MARRVTKRTPADETKSVVSVLADAPVTELPQGYGVFGPMICQVLHEMPERARTGPAAVFFIVGWTKLGTFDVVTRRLGVKSRVDALHRVRHAPVSCLVSFPACHPDLADEVWDASGQPATLGRNVNRRIAPRNSEVKRGWQLKLTWLRVQLLGELPDHIDGVSAGMRERAEKRVSEIFRSFVSGMKGVGDGAH